MKLKFSEFTKFGDSDKSLKHEFWSISRSCLSHVSHKTGWPQTKLREGNVSCLSVILSTEKGDHYL